MPSLCYCADHICVSLEKVGERKTTKYEERQPRGMETVKVIGYFADIKNYHYENWVEICKMFLINYEMNKAEHKMTWAILMPFCKTLGLCSWTRLGHIEMKIIALWIIFLY